MNEGIRWHVATHEHRERSNDWYWGFGIIALIAVGACIYFGNYLFAVILGLATLSIGLLLWRGPREHEIHVHPRGITLDGTLYPYDSLQSFWVHVENPYDYKIPEELHAEFEPRAHLLLSTHSYVHPRMAIPLADLDHAQEVRDYLAEFLEEVEQDRHLTEHIAEALGL